ncbi:MAG TPA: N-acetylmuramoyl-L-alanine amidase [Feifaniaceae bacterium]|nr:N-acetylmuramoyl-L-alanine amidase [Feifaniaceae bacterium]
MEKQTRLGKQFFDWMGVVLAVTLFALAASGVWPPLSAAAAEVLPARTDGGGVPLIILDAGHGGKDGGAVGVTGVHEAGINLEVARLVESGLREAGFAVEMTRKDEAALGENKRADMEARREIMRKDGVCAVVSIHMNKFRDTAIKGPMAFYMKGSEEGKKLATQVIAGVCESIGHPKRPANPGDYFVLRESIAPAVIIECGFLSNASDEDLLQDPAHQKKLAAGIVAGVAAYFANAPTMPPEISE